MSKKSDEMDVLFIRDVPKKLKSKFKASCARNGVSMKQKIIRFMRKVAKEVRV